MTELSEAANGAVIGRGGVTPSPNELESPSLFNPASNGSAPTAYEVKFLLTEEQARAVAERVSGHLNLDPHAEPALGNAYPTTSLYTDTAAFDVFHRNAGYNRDKYRVRRYGDAGPLFVERKTKNGDKVRKHRTRIDVSELSGLGNGRSDANWPGGWFHGEVLERHLRPVCRIAYERVAYMGAGENGAVRLTFDRRVRGVLAGGWEVGPVRAEPVLLADRVICEFKFRLAMPALFKGIVAELGLTPSPVSKYRLFVQTIGLAQPSEPRSDRGGTANG
jgi:hypothetical protein